MNQRAAHMSLTRDVEYDRRDFERIAAMLRSAAGIRMPDSNEALVYSRLSRRVRQLGFSEFSGFIDLIEAPDQAEERAATIAALTTNTTRFFREDYHFDAFASEIMPGLIDRARAGARIRLWSAGCSTGEEPYSLAAVVLRHFPEAAAHDVKILATDINRTVLARAAEGRYHAGATQSVEPVYAELLFGSGQDDPKTVRPEISALVTFRYLNFVEPWPVRGPFDAIFCRNVMIYMDESTQSRVWAALTDLLLPGGHLFIGHSERIGPELHDRLELVGKTTFRRRPAPASAPEPHERGSLTWP